MLTGLIQLSPFDVLQTYSASYTQDVPTTVGGLGLTSDGRKFRFGFNNTASTALAPGKNTQGPAVVSAYQGGTVSAQAIGDTSITYTFNGGAQTVVANYFSGGMIGIISGTGSVAQYQIKGSPAVTSSTTITLSLVDPIIIATSAAAVANLWATPYSAVIICPTAVTGSMTGTPLVSIPAQQYGWFCTGGTTVALNQGSTTIGLGLALSASVAGAFATVGATTNQIAVAIQAGVDTAYSFVQMSIE